jgi:phosphoserine phosphatase
MADLIVQGAHLSPTHITQLTGLTAAVKVELPYAGLARFIGVPNPRPAIEYCTAEKLDAANLDTPLRWKQFRLLAMDMDSTLITIECIDEIADLVGIKPQVAAITAAAMRGELDFPSALRQRVSLLAGLAESRLQSVYDERLRLSPGAEALIQAARAAGLNTLLVSGGFTYFTDRLKARLGLDETLANTLEIKSGTLTGQVLGRIVDADAKAAAVADTCLRLGCTTQEAIVIGDGANDLKMMENAGLSVAYRAKPIVQRQARIALNHVGLDGLLNLIAA